LLRSPDGIQVRSPCPKQVHLISHPPGPFFPTPTKIHAPRTTIERWGLRCLPYTTLGLSVIGFPVKRLAFRPPTHVSFCQAMTRRDRAENALRIHAGDDIFLEVTTQPRKDAFGPVKVFAGGALTSGPWSLSCPRKSVQIRG
jgi:hypothetical protein